MSNSGQLFRVNSTDVIAQPSVLPLRPLRLCGAVLSLTTFIFECAIYRPPRKNIVSN